MSKTWTMTVDRDTCNTSAHGEAEPRRWQRRADKRRTKTPRAVRRPPCVTQRATFLDAYRETFSIAAAAKDAGIKLSRHYEWLEKDATYRRKFIEVQAEVIDYLEGKAVELGTEGWEEAVRYRGRLCGYIEQHSDRLLLLLLRAFKSEWR
jgi:hypothetical protein